MKTIAILCLGVALACAETPTKDQGKAQSKSAKATKATNHAAVQTTGATSRTTKEHTASARAVRPNLRRATSTPPSPSLTPQQKAAAALPTVPQGAQEVGDNLYRYTDTQGKTWMYRKTPFGVSKWEDKPGEQPKVESPSPAPATVTDMGDSIQFERKTPFGPQKWVRKKSELTDEEKAMVAAQTKAKSSDPQKPPEEQ